MSLSPLELAARLPKAELHLHVEGTLEPELMFALARRNKMMLRFSSVDEARRAYDFKDLQSFLDVYYEGASVLKTEEDFHDLAWAYFKRAAAANVRHAEIFFDPQTHTARGVPYAVVLRGLSAACGRAKKELSLTSRLILCFLRHLSEDEAQKTLDDAIALGGIAGVGLDSSEKDRPPSLFKSVFGRARSSGLRSVALAGEEGPASYIAEALDLLRVERIDHGVRCLEDDALVERLAAQRIPLTVCPLSNVKLRVVDRLEDHPLKRMLDRGLRATVNSDDPAYFGGYADANWLETAKALSLSREDLETLARNSFESSWLDSRSKLAYSAEISRLMSL